MKTRSVRRTALGLLALAAALLVSACSPRIAGWGYSHWYRRDSPGASRGEFETHRSRCLEKAGASADESTPIEPKSAEEETFLACMHAANWCTSAYMCQQRE